MVHREHLKFLINFVKQLRTQIIMTGEKIMSSDLIGKEMVVLDLRNK